MSPVQGNSLADAFSNALPPPGAGTAYQVLTDRNLYFDRPIKTASNDTAASPLARTIAAGAQALGVDAHPSQVEFALRDFLGGAGQVYTEGSRLLAGEQKESGLPQDVPVAGGFVRRFVRGDVGERLAEARDERLSEEAAGILREAGVDASPKTTQKELVAPAPYRIGETILTREQQATYQQLVNAKVDTAIKALAALPEWDAASPKDREKAVEAAVRQVRTESERELAAEMGLELAKPKGGPSPTPGLRLPTSPTATRTPRATNTPAPTRTPGPTRTPTATRSPTPTRYVLPGGGEGYRLPTFTPDPTRSEAARKAAETRARNATATAEAKP